MAKNLKRQYNIVDDSKKLAYFSSILNKDFYNRAWVIPTTLTGQKELFKIGNTTVTYEDFAKHLMSAQKAYSGKTTPFTDIVEKEYKDFQENQVLKYHEDNLEFENEDFAQILKEYRDGLLLFDLMEKEVWNAAVQDSTGLQKYYDNHKSDYIWKDRVDVVVATSAKKNDIEKVKELLKKRKSQEEISKQLNSEAEQKVIFTKGIMETDHQALPKDMELKVGVSKVYQYNDAYHVLLINKVMPTANKTFEEARGKVISDYQNYIEDNWLNSLNERYKVVINSKELNTVKSQIQN